MKGTAGNLGNPSGHAASPRPSGHAASFAPAAPRLKGLLETSFLDWPGRLCAVLFLAGCNFRCPFCHNHPLVLEPEALPSLDLAEVRGRLRRFRGWLQGVCVTGGEPTLDPALVELLRALGEDGWAVKLDTNGSQPRLLARLLEERLVAMVAMDVKTVLVPGSYSRLAGVAADVEAIGRSIELLRASGIDHQFRMTVLPGYHGREEILAVKRLLGSSPFKLQNFRPATTLDPSFARRSGFSPARFAELERLVS